MRCDTTCRSARGRVVAGKIDSKEKDMQAKRNIAFVSGRRVCLAMTAIFLVLTASPVFACVAGTGTSVSCTDVAFDECLPGGARFDGTVTFSCGGSATIL